MSVRMKIGGIDVEVDTPAEARELLLLGNQGEPRNGVARTRSWPSQVKWNAKGALRSAERVIEFLNILKEAGGPVKPSVIARQLKMGPRGIGGMIFGIRNRSRGSGIPLDQICTRDMVNGKKYWIAGPALQKGIELEQERIAKLKELAAGE